jgi:hypothetical protein
MVQIDSEKKLKARDRLKEFAASKLSIPEFDKLPVDEKSVVLINFYINEIHNKTKTLIDEQDFEDGLVDGKGDLNIDFIHKDDGLVTIIQSKYRATAKNEDSADILYFQNIINKLIDNKSKPNKKLNEILPNIDLNNDNFRLIYLTFGKIEGEALIQAQSEPIYNPAIPDISDRVSYDYLDENMLNIEVRNAISISAGISEETYVIHAFKSSGLGKQIMEVDIANRKQVVMAVEATQLINLYKHNNFRDKIFNLNIRNFIGSTLQNKNIAKTIVDNSNNFFYFNNGISCLSRGLEINHEAGHVTVKGLQIINGAQTVKSLIKNEGKWKESIPKILMRITSIDKTYGEERGFTDAITRFNNSQNVVKVSDFRSNDSVQIDLQEKFNKLDLIGTSKKVSYQRKRTDEVKRGHELIKFEEFCKTIYSFLFDPIRFASNSTYLYDDKLDGGYVKIFGENGIVWDGIRDDIFKEYAAIWWLVKGFDERISLDKKNEKNKTNQNSLQTKWLIVYAARCLLERYFDSPTSEINKHYRTHWKIGEGQIGNWYLILYELAKQSVVYLYKDAAKREGFIHRNWLRSSDTVENLRNYCLEAPISQLKSAPSKD